MKSCSGGGIGSATGGGSVTGTSRMSSGKKMFSALLSLELVGTLAWLSTSTHVSMR